MKFAFTTHAKVEAKRRKISISQIQSVLENPQQVISGYKSKRVYQSKIRFENDKIYLVRVIVDEHFNPYRVITAYRTTKISKYWREK